MYTFIFVYSSAKLQTKERPVVKFVSGSPYSENQVELAANSEKVLSPGVYVALLEDGSGKPVFPTATIGVEYDQLDAGKDSWPTLVGGMRERVLAMAPSVTDDALAEFVQSRDALHELAQSHAAPAS